MSSGSNQTNTDQGDGSDGLPVAAIVCLAVGGYVILVIVFLIIRHILVTKGSCQSDCCSVESGDCCSFCAKANEACPCCCSSNVDGCLSKICGKRKKVNCIDILLCNCCGCTEGSCESCICTDLMPERLTGPKGCCQGATSITCGPFCACCREDDLPPNTCGCLCLEVKVRSPRLGGSFRRSNSADPSQRIKNRRFSTHEPPQRQLEDNTGSDDGGIRYRVTDSVESKISTSKVVNFSREDNDKGARQRSSSHSPTLSAPRKREAFVNNSGSFDSLSNSSQTKHFSSAGKSGHHVNFYHSGRKSEDIDDISPNATSSTKLSGSLSEDSLKNSSGRALLNDSKSNSKSKSRSRRSLREGQKSQRFPNKVLVSADSLRLSLEKSQSTVSNSSGSMTQPYSLSSHRPLPPLRNSVESIS